MSNTNTSLDVNSLEFWEKVKDEYRPRTFSFICFCSPVFSSAWNDKNGFIEIRHLARTFISESKIKSLDIHSGDINTLFLYWGSLYTNIELKVKFIDWCIERFKNAKLQDNTGPNGVNPSPPPNFPENNADTGN